MNVRVVGGMYGGRVLAAPGRDSTHAMSERVRNAIFNSISTSLTGAQVLDAFAGSGAIGIEAMSRGAESIVFLEKDRVAARIIGENLQNLHIDAKVIKTTVSNWLETSGTDQTFDIIFADPPYHEPQLSVVARLFERVTMNGLFVLSHPKTAELEAPFTFELLSRREYGNAVISYYKKVSK